MMILDFRRKRLKKTKEAVSQLNMKKKLKPKTTKTDSNSKEES
jgi:hypothetical protein